ncbi:Endonuclease, Uma2 family (restriction endonuclease fold) [Granulicella rosea]|uniref:Endonuclease, Uma2 family (Restriction endonuclease fold) n=1 Tax=Granulicella rosea TaxID=474952 RepID=A0A239H975_9BACT|nr:Uma2 family endonuclease [Granulicella rosea]SNS76804.1 Endonuclease, Uma2 family (restriction endonuclease fold) [Granulicella rosea]
MATTHLISVEEYLRTTYRPDVDYVDGEIQERNLGELDHGTIQGAFMFYLGPRRREWNIRAVTELRVQVKEERFRVPDVCILDADAPKEQIIYHPPLVCIEVLSPSDTIYGMRQRVRDYVEMGVRQVWIVDPKDRTAIVCEGNSMVEQTDGTLKLPGTKIEVPLADLFSVLDE